MSSSSSSSPSAFRDCVQEVGVPRQVSFTCVRNIPHLNARIEFHRTTQSENNFRRHSFPPRNLSRIRDLRVELVTSSPAEQLLVSAVRCVSLHESFQSLCSIVYSVCCCLLFVSLMMIVILFRSWAFISWWRFYVASTLIRVRSRLAFYLIVQLVPTAGRR